MKKTYPDRAGTVATKKIGIPELAELAQVSIGTVDRALHNRKRVSEATRNRILNIAKRVGYTPNLAARMLSIGRASIRIGVCIPKETHYFYDQMRDGILHESRRFESMGVEVLYNPVDRLGVGECERVKELLGATLKGLIITPGDPHRLRPLIEEAEGKNIRVICVASDAPESARSSVVCIDPDVGGNWRLSSWRGLLFREPEPQLSLVCCALNTIARRQKPLARCFGNTAKGATSLKSLKAMRTSMRLSKNA